MKYIKQPTEYGCLVASLAMALDYGTYQQMEDELRAAVFHDPKRPGIHSEVAVALMNEHGYGLVRRYRYDQVRCVDRDVWPCAPFAPIHLCYVHATRGPHACFMDQTGRVFDPWDETRTSLQDPIYRAIDHIDGFFRIH